jgi:formylmethanofuran dehydrogenase subunit E
MIGEPISLFEEATEHTPLKDREAGWMICSECAELEEEPLMARTTLICGNCADRLMAEQHFVR